MTDTAKLVEFVPAPITDVTSDQVQLVYSGKPGCGCGCRGKYWVHPLMVPQATACRGYPYEAEDVSLVQVRRVLSIMQKRADEVKAHMDVGGKQAIYSIEDAVRYYWLYVPVAA